MSRPQVLTRARRNLSVYPALAVASGAVLALVTTSIDALVDPPWLPWLPLAGGSSAQALLGGITGAMITAAAVLFWVRAMLVQLAADHFSPRVLQPYLDNRLQHGLMAFVIGTFVFCAVALVHQPEPSGGADAAPLVTLLVAILLATGVLLAIVGALANGARSTRIEEVVRAIAEETIAAVRLQHPARGRDPEPADGRPAGADPDAYVVAAPRAGWVRHVSGDRLLTALPADTTAALHVGVGDFVAAGMPLCSVWPLAQDQEALDERIQDAVEIGRERSRNGDIVLGLRELVDVATASLAPGTPDSTAGLETLVHLGAVVRELLRRDPPRTWWADEHGRVVRQLRALSLDDFVGIAFDQVRTHHAGDLTVATTLLSVLARVAEDLERHGHGDRTAPLWRQAALTVACFERRGPVDEDLAALRATARSCGLTDHAGTTGAR